MPFLHPSLFWSCFWQPSESDWAISSMCFPILPHFEKKNISIFYLICNLAPSTISQNSRYKVSPQRSSLWSQCWDNVLPTICLRTARKIRRKKEMRRRWRPSNWDGVCIYIYIYFFIYIFVFHYIYLYLSDDLTMFEIGKI